MKRVYLLYFFLFLIVCILISIIFINLFRNVQPPNNDTSTDQTKIFPQITSVRSFNIIGSNITKDLFGVTQFVKIKFNKPVLVESLDIKIIPEEKITTIFDSTFTELTIQPRNAWSFNSIYTIKISNKTLSQDQQYLNRDHSFTFITIKHGGI